MITLEPIGVVRSPYTDKAQIPKGPHAQHEAEGTLDIRPDLEAGLTDIEGFSHIIVLFHFHRAGKAKLRAVPPGESRPRGIFSTRSPHRPNPLGLSVLKLLRRDGRRLEVAGVDIIDGTPVLDIKPYTTRDRKSRIRTGWLQGKPRPAR